MSQRSKPYQDDRGKLASQGQQLATANPHQWQHTHPPASPQEHPIPLINIKFTLERNKDKTRQVAVPIDVIFIYYYVYTLVL